MSNNIEILLTDLGLTKNEQRIYLFLLSNGISSPSDIARETKIQRTNTYYVLDLLKEKRLIKTVEREGSKRKSYEAEDPNLLLALHDRKRELLSQALPDIRTLYEKRENKPTFEFYEGLEEIQSIYLRTLSSEIVYALGSTKELAEKMPNFYKSFFEKLKEKKVILKDILSHPSKDVAAFEAKAILQSLYDVWTLPAEYGDLPTDILVWKDYVAIIALGDPFFGTVITHPQIAETFRIVMKVLHEQLERV